MKKIFIVLFCCVALVGCGEEKATLHKANVEEWKKGSFGNRTATCKDFCAVANPNYSDIKYLKADAVKLRNCIDEAVKGANDTTSIAQIASMCIITMQSK